jgi:two-component system sensor kinase FixL
MRAVDGEPASPAPEADGARPVRTYTLRTYLTVMALAVLLPTGLLGAFAIRQVVKEYQYAYQERLHATARLLDIALDSEIQMRKTAIMAIATSPLVDQPVGPDLYNYARQIGEGLGTWVTIKNAQTVLVNTRVPYGAKLPPRLVPWNDADAARYRVTDSLRPADLSAPFASVVGPVFRDGRVVATVSIPFAHEQLGRRLSAGLLSSDGVLCLLDGNGVIIARTRNQEKYVGLTAPAWLRALAASPGPAIGTGSLIDGGPVIVAIAHPSEAPEWTVVVAQPVAGYYQEWFRPLMVLGGGGLVLLLVLLLVVVHRFSLWLVRPLKTLTQNAKIVARGGRERLPEAPHTSRVEEFEALRVSLNEAAQVMDGRAEAIRVAFASARRERNLLHSVVNGTSDPTFVKDLDGRLVLANGAGLAMLGLPAAKALGQLLREPGIATEQACLDEDRRVIESGLPLMIERSVDHDGERRSFVGTKSPWRSASDEVLGVVMIIHDITEWKRSEHRLREIQGELIRTGRLSAMGAMANGLAHELNQPLAAITNYLGAARRLMAQAPSERAPALVQPAVGAPSLGVASGAIEDACTQAMRAGEIVSRLRDFIGRGVAAMRIETIGDMIADASALALPQDTRGRVDMHVSIDPELGPVFVDRLQIQQVLVNLLLNAVQSMAGSPRQQLTITAGRDASGDTCIEVADTGTGIPEQMLSRVFEPFVTTRPQGLGMGLPIARMIVAAHGGTLVASNNADGGATLTLVLPAVLSMEDADV